MLFFSADFTEVQAACGDLLQAGISCEVRHSPGLDDLSRNPASVELWIHNDEDAHRALMRCVARQLGFSRRRTRIVWVDELIADQAEVQAA